MGGLDVTAPLGAVGAALPGSATAPRAADAAIDLGAALAVWAGRVGDVGENVAASAADYGARDAEGAARLRTSGATP